MNRRQLVTRMPVVSRMLAYVLILGGLSLGYGQPPKGLKILSTTLDAPTPLNPELRPVTVKVQNVTDKAIVAHAFVVHEFDRDGKEINPGGAGVGRDFAGPNPSPTDTENVIPPGQIRSVEVYSANLKAVTVNVTVAGVVYDDRSSEGGAARMFFITRQRNAQELRAAAAQEQPGKRKTDLEKQAEWYEAHGPLEAQK